MEVRGKRCTDLPVGSGGQHLRNYCRKLIPRLIAIDIALWYIKLCAIEFPDIYIEMDGVFVKAIRVMSIFGTRPEAIKMLPLVKEIARRPSLEGIVCVTGQHREMLDQVLEAFEVVPDYDLNLMMPGQTLTDITANVLHGMQPVLQQAKPDLVLVHGDTTTSFAGALAAFYQQLPVGHVEAGLRTYDCYSPFPEEMNRTLTGCIARLHFAPTHSTPPILNVKASSGR